MGGAADLNSLNPPLDLGHVIALSDGNRLQSTCAIIDTGELKCWGLNQRQYGALGYDQVGLNHLTGNDIGGNPGDIAALHSVNLGTRSDGSKRTAVSVAGGQEHAC